MTMAKGIMIVDGQRVPFDGEKNVLSVIRKAGIDMPTFCYYSELSVHGACRMCIVENVKTGKIDASCSMEPRDGLEIRTNTARLLRHRRMILELMLASHDCSCTTCGKSGNCRLQELAQRFGVSRVRFPDTRERYEQDNTSLAIFRDPNKCILCGDCVRVCEELQGQGILNYAHRGSELQVMPAFDKKLDQTKCVGCGQCAAVCTTGAITVKNQIGQAWQALHDPKNRVVVQIAPAVRVALGEEFGLPAGANVMDKLVKALKLMGVEEVYDTNFAADMTTISEAQEFLDRLKPAPGMFHDLYEITDDCIGCGICTKVCPKKCFHMEGQKSVWNPAGCISCMACIHACPMLAIKLKMPEKNPQARYRNENISLCEIVDANNQWAEPQE